MNVEIPPAQDSPKHILNALNDDCIQLILRRLEKVLDFLSAAETCVRFQENAKLTFRTQFKEIRIDYSSFSNTVKVDRVPSFLNIFGHLITGLDFDRQAMDDKLGDDIQNMIANLCGKTLKTVKLRSNSKVVDFNTPSPFEALEELEVYGTNVRNFEHQTQLEKLYVSGLEGSVRDLDWLIQSFPKLEGVEFLLLGELQHNQLIEFLELNPQLKRLELVLCSQITQTFFENIVNSVPNLEHLTFWSRFESYSSNHLIQIANLSKLKYLKIDFSKFHILQMKQLIASLIENNVQIETLFLEHKWHPSIYELNISHLKSLKNLYVPIRKSRDLVHLVQNLPQLQKIVVKVEKNIRLNDIKDALRYGEHLSVLMVGTIGIKINSNNFNSILNLATLARVKVLIRYRFLSHSPVDGSKKLFLNENHEWLEIKEGNILYELRDV